MARRPLVRTFSWSVSRDRLFRGCPRAYYFHYYGSWGGWEADAPPAARELYVLKHLSTRQQWAGAAIHEVLRGVLAALRDGRVITQVDAAARLTGLMRNRFAASRARRYWQEPRRGGLVEHEYDLPVDVSVWRAVHDDAARALAGAYRLGLLERLARIAADDWLAVERRDSFEVDGVPVWCVPDLAFREGERLVIVDWKTGPPFHEPGEGGGPARDDTAFQLACYALYARRRFGVPTGAIRVGVAFLGAPEYRESAVDEAELASAEARLRASIAAMRAPLDDPAADAASCDAFPLTEDPTRCERCPFRRPCRGAAWQPAA